MTQDDVKKDNEIMLEKSNFIELKEYIESLLNELGSPNLNQPLRDEEEIIARLIDLLSTKVFGERQKYIENLQIIICKREKPPKNLQENEAKLSNLFQQLNNLHRELLKERQNDSIERLNPSIVNRVFEKLDYLLKKFQRNQRQLVFTQFKEEVIEFCEKKLYLRSNEKLRRRREIIVALRSRKKKIFTRSLEDIPAKKLPWKFFPKGSWTVEQIVKEFGKYVAKSEIVDESRIWKIYDNLHPTDCYISQDGFNRYIAFCFDWTEKVVLECPIYGNAIYVVKGNWKEVTKLHKWGKGTSFISS